MSLAQHIMLAGQKAVDVTLLAFAELTDTAQQAGYRHHPCF